MLVSSPGFAGQPWERELAWAELIALPKAVLQPAPRSGRKHKRCQENYTRCLLQRWLDGEKIQLFVEAARDEVRRTRADPSEGGLLKRTIELIEEGKYSQGCKTLVSKGLATDTAATLNSLQAKHPRGEPVPPELASAQPMADRIKEQSVSTALRAFAKGSSPGPSGLRAQHLLDATARPEQSAALQALTDVVNVLAQGRAPRELAPHLAGATLVALEKEGGDVRPIAIGEVLRRLTSKCICASIREGAQEFFQPLQVGVACPLGLEASVHVVGQYAARHLGSSNKLIMTLDFKNAFNTVNRSTFLRACREHFPEASPWAAWCYSSPSRLLYNGRLIESSAGVQQGDNLGPFLFSLAVHPLLQHLKAW